MKDIGPIRNVPATNDKKTKGKENAKVGNEKAGIKDKEDVAMTDATSDEVVKEDDTKAVSVLENLRAKKKHRNKLNRIYKGI